MLSLYLTDLIGVDILQEFQDWFYEFTGVAAIIFDEKGNEVTKPSGFTDFCMKVVRKSPVALERCELYDRIGNIKSIETAKPAVYECHAGLLNFISPIMLQGKMIGRIAGGQARADDLSDKELREAAADINADPDVYVEAYHRTYKFSVKEMKKAADFLGNITNLLVMQAYKNYQKIRDSHNSAIVAKNQSEYFINVNTYLIEHLKDMMEYSNVSSPESDAGKLKEILDTIYEKGDIILSVVNNHLEYLNLLSGNGEYGENKYDIRKLIEPIIHMYSKSEKNEGLDFKLTIDESVPVTLFGDPMRIYYIISRVLKYRMMHKSINTMDINISCQIKSYSTWLIIEFHDDGFETEDKYRDEVERMASSGNLFDFKFGREKESEMSVIGTLLYQMSGEISFGYSEGYGNTIIVKIPQLMVGSD